MEISEIADLAEEEEVSTPALYGQVHAFKRLMRQAGFVDSTKHKRNGAMTDHIEKDPTRSKDVKRVTSPDAISSNRGMGARAPCPAESWLCSMEWWMHFFHSEPQTDQKNAALEALGKEMAEEGESTRLCDGALFQCPE